MSFRISHFRVPLNLTRAVARRLAASDGFTLIEVLVAIAVLAVVLGAIGAVVATTVRGVHSIDSRLPLLETAQNLLASLPERDALKPGTQTGGSGDFRWRIDVAAIAVSPSAKADRTTPLFGDASAAPPKPKWQPYSITVRVEGSDGPPIRLDTVRLLPIPDAQRPPG
jgi:general secretion pathway protein I